MRVSEIRVKRIRVNQGLGVYNTPLINLFFQQTLDAPSDQSNNSSLTRYDQDHHRIRKRREKSTIILVSIVLIFLLCHMFRFSLKVCYSSVLSDKKLLFSLVVNKQEQIGHKKVVGFFG